MTKIFLLNVLLTFMLILHESNTSGDFPLSPKSKSIKKGFTKIFHMRPFRPIFEYNDVSELSVYYDIETNQKVRNMLPRPWYKPGWPLRLPFRGGRCNCTELHCSCCAGLQITQFNFKRKVCANFDYQPEESLILMDVTMNDTRIFNTEYSAKNPPPFCIPIPVPYLPPGFVDFCIRIFDIYVQNQKLHMCMDMETRVDRAPVLILHFDCMLMGLDGVSLVKPDTNTTQSTQTSDPVEDNEQQLETNQTDSDVYDPVDDIKTDNITENTVSNGVKYIR